MNWSQLAGEYLKEHPETHESIATVLEVIRDSGLDGVTQAVEPDAAVTAKAQSTEFFLLMIADALEDHQLTLEEVAELKTLERALRIEEGDLLRHHGSVVTDLLCQEAALIFEDQGISAAEEAQEFRLQEVFGLGYDEFITLLESEVDRLHASLIARVAEFVERGEPENWLGTEWSEVRGRLNALSLTQYVQWLRQGEYSRAGYIYLLVNPSMPGMVKVGRTSQPPSKRAAELTGATGVPTPFEVVFELLVADQFAAEAYVHRVLDERGRRVSGNREFFAVQPDEAIEVMLEARENT